MSLTDIDNNINDILSNKPPVFLNKAIRFLSQHLEEAQSNSRLYEISEANIKKILDNSNASESVKKSILSKIGSSTTQSNDKKTADTIKPKPVVSAPQQQSHSIENKAYTQASNQQRDQPSNSASNITSNSALKYPQTQRQQKDPTEETKRLQKVIDKLEDDKRVLNKKIEDLEEIVKDLKKGSKSENLSACHDEELKNAYSLIEKNKRERATSMIEKEKLELRIKYLENENKEISSKSSKLAIENKELKNQIQKQDQLIHELNQKNSNESRNSDYNIQQLTLKFENEKQILEQDLRNQIDDLKRQLNEARNNASSNQVTHYRSNTVNSVVVTNTFNMTNTVSHNGSVNSVSMHYSNSSFHYESI